MEKVETIVEKLQEKRELFTKYAWEMDQLLYCDTEQVEGHMDRIEHYAWEIDSIDERIRELCRTHAQGDLLWSACRNACNKGDLPEWMQPVFEAGQRIFPIISNLFEKQQQVVERIGFLRDDLEEKIRKNNKSPAAQASKFYTGFSQAESGDRLSGKA